MTSRIKLASQEKRGTACSGSEADGLLERGRPAARTCNRKSRSFRKKSGRRHRRKVAASFSENILEVSVLWRGKKRGGVELGRGKGWHEES